MHIHMYIHMYMYTNITLFSIFYMFLVYTVEIFRPRPIQ